ncbi:MAG: hypothetical protein NTY02_18620 [Acidobacteria bacterium]|nr:hypothetical protein [Acidobacteriota bacterium]
MKIAISAVHFAALRNFEGVVAALAERGHDVVLVADEPDDMGGARLADDLARRFPERVQARLAPSHEGVPWFVTARKLRQGLDYVRFLDPRYRPFPKLQSRSRERVPRSLVWFLGMPGAGTRVGRDLVTWLLGEIDRAMPQSEPMEAFLRDLRPDVLVLVSVTNPRTPQLDHLRAAQAVGIPTVAAIYSWDHLSSKALIRVMPHAVFVWNDTQKQEAVDLHGIPDSRVVVTGAQCYDQWFGRQASRTREAFLADMELPTDRLLLLYVCSALTPDPKESRFTRAWLEAIRTSDDEPLRRASVIIRPHPERRAEWENVDWSDLGPVRIAGANPLTASAKNDYFDALLHSAAVVGLVTSAFLEAAIAGRPVLTVLPPELHEHQEGMLHFKYLLDVDGGLLTTARSLPEHVRQLEAAVQPEWGGRSQQDRFLRAFVRPYGLDAPATPRFVEALEQAPALPAPDPVRKPRAWARRVAAWLINPENRWAQWILRSRREAVEWKARAEQLARNRAEKKARRRTKAGKLRELEAYRAAKHEADRVRQAERDRDSRAGVP